MAFEFDETKSAANLEKHGIDFQAAQGLWLDREGMEVPARSEAEPRLKLVARFRDKIWTAIFTQRGDNVRIISVRRARAQEEEAYEQNDSGKSGSQV